MSRFVQPVPPPVDPYAGDGLLRSWLERHLGPGGHAAAKGRLADLAADVTGPLRAAHADAEAHPPTLVRYDPWGARIDRIDTSAGWQAQRAAAARHAVVALPYLPDARGTWGAAARVVQHALLHLYGPESATFSCPVAMADGAAALLSMPDVDATVRDAWLPRLISTDPATAITSGQWMTESQGGSDLGRSSTTRPTRGGRVVAADRGEVVLLRRRRGDGGGAGPTGGRRARAAGCSPRSSFPGTRSTHRWPTARRRAHPHRVSQCTGSRTSSAPGRCPPPRSACATRTPSRWVTRRCPVWSGR